MTQMFRRMSSFKRSISSGSGCSADSDSDCGSGIFSAGTAETPSKSEDSEAMQRPKRHSVKKPSAAVALKKGLSALRERIAGKHGEQSDQLYVAKASDNPLWVLPSNPATYTKYDLFRKELSKSSRVRGHVKDCTEKLSSENAPGEASTRQLLTRLCDTLFWESWRVAENVCKDELDKAQHCEAQLQKAECMRLEALNCHMKEVTALKDQIRCSSGLPSISVDALAVSFFRPLDYLDESTRSVVHTVVDEQLKAIVSKVEDEDNADNALYSLLRSRMEIQRDRIAHEEHKQLEASFESERKEHKQLVAELEQRLATLQTDLTCKRDEASALQETMHEQLQTKEQQVSTLRAEMAKSQADVTKLKAMNQDLLDRHADAHAANPVSLPPVEMQVVEDAFDDHMKQMLTKIRGRQWEMLPGASAAMLLEQATTLHNAFEVDSLESCGSDIDLLTVLVHMADQVAREVQQEANAVLSQAAHGMLSPLMRLMSLQATVARRQAGMFVILSTLLIKAVCDFFGVVQGKGLPQAKQSLMLKDLQDVRGESKKQISACFRAAQSGFEQLEEARQQLKSYITSGNASDTTQPAMPSPVNNFKRTSTLGVPARKLLPSLSASDGETLRKARADAVPVADNRVPTDPDLLASLRPAKQDDQGAQAAAPADAVLNKLSAPSNSKPSGRVTKTDIYLGTGSVSPANLPAMRHRRPSVNAACMMVKKKSEHGAGKDQPEGGPKAVGKVGVDLSALPDATNPSKSPKENPQDPRRRSWGK